MNRPLSLALLLGMAPSCNREDLYSDRTFSDNVREAYADCSSSEIRFLAAKQNLQTAFENCGSNKFSHFAWSPDGMFIYFQATHGAYLMNADQKKIGSVPLPEPRAAGAWAQPNLLVVPLGPAEGATKERIVYYGLPTVKKDGSIAQEGKTATWEVDVREVKGLTPLDGDGKMLFTAVGADGVRRPYTIDDTGAVARAFDWIEGGVTDIVASPEAGLVAWSDEDKTVVARADDGTVVATLPGVLRGIPHSGGRYVALERMGEPISPFDQRAWDEVSPETRKRELAKQEQWLERLPEWAPREMEPPELQVLDLESGKLYSMTGFYGDRFQWYEAASGGYFASFMLWGIEGKQLNRNVALANLTERFRMMANGEVPYGVELVDQVIEIPKAEAKANVDGGG